MSLADGHLGPSGELGNTDNHGKYDSHNITESLSRFVFDTLTNKFFEHKDVSITSGGQINATLTRWVQLPARRFL